MSRSIGVLLIQLGTPDAPTPAALRPYLRQFLSDPRVIEAPRLWWWLILHGWILRRRPAQSALKYRRIWDPVNGSPLLHHTRLQSAALQRELPHISVRFGMQVGNPSLAGTVRQMISEGVERLLVFPLYPQYSATTIGSALDALFVALGCERRIPALRVVPPFYAHPAYLDAVTTIIGQNLAGLSWEPDCYLLSFHGLPVRYVRAGDPYARQVEQTAQLLQERLRWPVGRCHLTYQSRFGREAWLEPATDQTVEAAARRGIRRMFVATPGFTADCLETVDEIGFEVAEIFHRAGGDEFRLCPCLNAHPAWIAAMKQIVLEEGSGWL